jgi:hypothetical protein
MATLAKLQENAETCFRLAEGSRDPDLKVAWAKLTEAWLSLVAQEKRRARHNVVWRGSPGRTARRGRSARLKAA